MAKIIKLTQGYETIVDDEDFVFLSQWKWQIARQKDSLRARRVIRITSKLNGVKLVGVSMPRQILGITNSEIFVDHINGNTLDNRKSNLRLCTSFENMQNVKPRTDRKFGKYKGVSVKKYIRKDGSIKMNFTGSIKYNGTLVYLGAFKTQEEAAIAYNKAAAKYHGKFAKLNIIK